MYSISGIAIKSQELASVYIPKVCIQLILQSHLSNDTVLTGAGYWLEYQSSSWIISGQ